MWYVEHNLSMPCSLGDNQANVNGQRHPQDENEGSKKK